MAKSTKGTTVGHASSCDGGKCRGGCHKRMKEEILSFTVDNSQIGRKSSTKEPVLPPLPRDNMITTFGYSTQGKSAAAMNWVERVGATPGSIQFDIGSYMNEKEKELLAKRQADYFKIRDEAIEARKQTIEGARNLPQVTEDNDHRDHWETLGRLVGMAYAESDTAFFALLEGFHRGRLNENQGRRAMGGPKA